MVLGRVLESLFSVLHLFQSRLAQNPVLATDSAQQTKLLHCAGLPPEEKDFLAQERDGQPSESGVASTSGRESEPWSMDQQGYGALPAWVAQKPCLLWLWATAGTQIPVNVSRLCCKQII